MDGKRVSMMLPFFHIKESNLINISDDRSFPKVSIEEISDMYQISTMFPKEITVFPKIRKNESENNYYGDIYFFGEINDEIYSYKRFLIVPGYRMPLEEERDFIGLCRDRNLIVEDGEFHKFVSVINKVFPQYHFSNYESKEVGMAMEALYFSSHKGLLEILYKANLENIANSISDVEGVDYQGDTPSEIIGGMPIKLLRIMNEKSMVERLFSEEEQSKAVSVYEKYSGFIKKGELPTRIQWKYFEHLYNTDNKFNRKVYDELKHADGDLYIHLYDMYLQYRDLVKGYYPVNRIPHVSEVSRVVYALETINQCIQLSGAYDRRIRKVSNRNRRYRYQKDGLIVRMPETLKDFTMEAGRQKNCLMSYLGDMLKGNTIIAFVRKESNPEKSYLTLEICGGEIIQARGECNRELTDEEYSFIEEYCEAKGISIDEFE